MTQACIRPTVVVTMAGDEVLDERHWLTATAMAAAIAERRLSPMDLMQALLDRIEQVDPKINAWDYVQAQRRRGQQIAAVEDVFRDVDVLLWALAMMSGLTRGGLPLSVQFAGRYFDEATLLRVAAAFERATPWHTLRPPI